MVIQAKRPTEQERHTPNEIEKCQMHATEWTTEFAQLNRSVHMCDILMRKAQTEMVETEILQPNDEWKYRMHESAYKCVFLMPKSLIHTRFLSLGFIWFRF